MSRLRTTPETPPPGLVLRRVLVLPALAMLLATLVLAEGEPSVRKHADGPEESRSGTWEPAYSRKYPACVSLVLWPPDETPVAVVVRDDSGAVSRMPLRDAVHSARRGELAGVRVIGACRDG